MLLNGKRFVCVVDLEATCWPEGAARGADMEIIEVGAMMLDASSLEPLREFETLVRPARFPALSEFCLSLTGIAQARVDGAPAFPAALERFRDWLGPPGESLFSSWGAYDRRQLLQDCRSHGVPYPFDQAHLNLKSHFAGRRGCRPCGMKGALRKLGLPLEGSHHRAMDDVRNIVRILRAVGLGT